MNDVAQIEINHLTTLSADLPRNEATFLIKRLPFCGVRHVQSNRQFFGFGNGDVLAHNNLLFVERLGCDRNSAGLIDVLVAG